MVDKSVERRIGRVGVAGHPYSSLVLPVPIVCFVGALITDIAYDNSGGTRQWVNFSSWLLFAGVLFGAIAAILMIIDLARLPQLRSRWGWASFALLLVTLAIELINSFVHARDGWTAVVPAGLILSAICAVLIMSYGWLWHESRYGPGDRP
jgi:uncharacterized membrane protein